MRILAVVLTTLCALGVTLAVAGCGGGGGRTMAQRVEWESPGTLRFPDGSILTVRVWGNVPARCQGYPFDDPTGDCTPAAGCETSLFRAEDGYGNDGLTTPMDKRGNAIDDPYRVDLAVTVVAVCS